MQYSSLLHLVELFSDLDAEHLHEIGSLCHWQRYPKGVEIISQRETSSDVFFVVEGRVSAKGYSPDGKEVTYLEMGIGETFGEFSALDGGPRSASIEALEESYIGQMSSENFQKILESHSIVGMNLLNKLVKKNRELTERVFEFSTLSVRYRICAELIRMIDDLKSDSDNILIEPAPSHYQMATKLSTHREAVTRELSNLVSQGILKVGRKKIRVLDSSRLRDISRIKM